MKPVTKYLPGSVAGKVLVISRRGPAKLTTLPISLTSLKYGTMEKS